LTGTASVLPKKAVWWSGENPSGDHPLTAARASASAMNLHASYAMNLHASVKVVAHSEHGLHSHRRVTPAPALGRGPVEHLPGGDPGGVTALGYASFILVGWGALLVPSMVPAIERDFVQPDAGVGVLYLVSALLFVIGSLASGYLMERLGRGLVLPAAVFAMSAGLGLESVAPTWAVFVIGAGIGGLGSGAVEVGMNGLFLDRFHENRGQALSRLHLCFSLGALAAPLAVGALVGVGVTWRLPFAVTSAIVLAVGLRLATRDLGVPHVATATLSGRAPGGRRVPLPLVFLALAIASYVASESGVSSWLVRFLDAAPVGVATLALSLFWAGLAIGRLVASRVADRFAPISIATACGLAAGAALVAAVVVPWIAASIALFAVAGVVLGPIYPMIVASAGALYPARANAVSGVITAAAVTGSVVYPPVMGFISNGVGLGVGMAGAGLLALACAGALVVARLLARPSGSSAPVPASNQG
jgi:OFA family oxalate/formate antiporter-like MFS transporter